MQTLLSFNDSLSESEVLEIYEGNNWSSAKKPEDLLAALHNSHSLLTARISGKLVGLANAIADGYLVVYYPHLIVHLDFQGKGIGTLLMTAMLEKYTSYHQQMITADCKAIEFYQALGFSQAGETQSMWIYDGNDH